MHSRHGETTHRIATLLPRLALLVLIASPLAARDKTDIVYFTNGDQILCEIRELKRGKLTVKSIGFGTINIEWDKIASLESGFEFQIELQSGTRYTGTLAPGGEPGKLAVATAAGTSRLDMARVVSARAVEQSIIQRMDGSVSIGYDFTQASTATNWNSAGQVFYRTEKWEADVSVSSLVKIQEGADDVNRQNGRFRYTRFYQARWFAVAIASAEQNSNQALQIRGLGGGGFGRRLVQSNRTTVAVFGGAVATREKFEDTDVVNNAEAVGGFSFDTFRFSSPEVQITADLLFLPSMTQTGRFRLQANASARLELLKDLFWQVGIYESFDSDPQSTLANRNDFSLTTSFGWSW